MAVTLPASVARAADAARDRAAQRIADDARALVPRAEISVAEGRVTITGRGLLRRWSRDTRLRWLGAGR